MNRGRFVRTMIAASSLAAYLGQTSPAQVRRFPLIEIRQTAAFGLAHPSENVRETDVAIGPTHAMTVFIQTAGGIGYSMFDRTGWTEATLSLSGVDPSVVYDAAGAGFVACWDQNIYAKVRRFDLATGTLGPVVNAYTGTGALFFDKPWIVAGRNSATTQELYAVCIDHPFSIGVGYARSLDGGLNWTFGAAANSGGGIYSSSFCAQPTVDLSAAGAPLFVAYTKQSPFRFQFLGATDLATGGAVFDPLDDTLGRPLEVLSNSTADNFNAQVPGPFKVLRVPYLVADPTRSGRLYLLYHDLAPGSVSDVDIFCVRLNWTGNGWLQSRPVRVNCDDATVAESDQFLPAAAVDAAGRLHVAFYDDRRFDQPDTQTNARFDVYYAVSTDRGASFRDWRLKGSPDEPALDFNLNTANQVPGEYPGIATLGDRLVMITFAGTSSNDPTPDQSVIHAARVRWR